MTAVSPNEVDYQTIVTPQRALSTGAAGHAGALDPPRERSGVRLEQEDNLHDRGAGNPVVGGGGGVILIGSKRRGGRNRNP